jgi:hypothetical protein
MHVLKMADFDLRSAPTREDARNASPFFQKLNEEGISHVELEDGHYRLDDPVEISYGVRGVNKSVTIINKNFPSDSDTEGMLNIQNLFGFTLKDFQLRSMKRSQRNGKGTGTLLTLKPRNPGEQVSRWRIESVEATSDASWELKEAFHAHTFLIDGSVGQPNTSSVRQGLIKDTNLFGCEIDGYAFLLRSAGGIRYEGGGITWSAGRRAAIRIEGANDTSLRVGNAYISPDACMDIEVKNANDIMFIIPGVWGNVTLESGVTGVTGMGNVRGERRGDWRPQTQCRWL